MERNELGEINICWDCESPITAVNESPESDLCNLCYSALYPNDIPEKSLNFHDKPITFHDYKPESDIYGSEEDDEMSDVMREHEE
jgi:hypothetical protein